MRFIQSLFVCFVSLSTLVPQDKQLETKFDSYLKASNLDVWMKRLTARPHHTSSPYDKENAEFIAAQFKSWGYETKIEEFYVLFPTPKTRSLEMTMPLKITASLTEPGLAEDATSGQTGEQLPIYNAYSTDGDVTGELVYVNYGVPKDYEELEQRGIDVKGKIVIARYGGAWRGIKPKVAAEHGAVGCIIYSDPRDDGFYQGDVYPKGAWRNENGAQRGSVMDMPLYNGDPLTPGIGATKDAKRLDRKDAQTITKVPVLPISYSDALPLLKSLTGQVVPDSWRGALPITYHFGPGKSVVHLRLEFNWNIVPIYDVIATMKGSEFPDEWIIRGNHHDGWVNGAGDPTSGMVATMEEARGLAELVRTGWKPKRTIVYCAWDAEEQGLLGSTEWAETHAQELKQKAVVYINSDGNGRGFFGAAGSHTLEPFVSSVVKDVVDPQKSISTFERAKAQRIATGSAEESKEARERSTLRIGALGSGSDYTTFLDFLGIAALSIGYGGEDGGGSYHSIYDSYDHFKRFGDPGFKYGVALAQTGGRMVIRLADAAVLPFEFVPFAETISRYAKEVEILSEEMRTETDELNKKINERSLELSADPTEPSVVPKPKDPVPFLNFAPLQNAVKNLDAAAKDFDNTLAANRDKLSQNAKKTTNALFRSAEHWLTSDAGLPGRPWYKHQMYAPGAYTGYGVKSLPAIRESIELRKWKEAEEQIVVVAGVLEGYAKNLKGALANLK